MKRFLCGLAALAMTLTASTVFAVDVTQHQWASPNSDGDVVGRVVVPRGTGISALRGAEVTLIDGKGKLATAATESDKTGRFSLTSVTPGVYTLMIQSDDAFACCAMHIVGADVPLNSTFEIAAGAIDYSTVRSAMVRYAPTESTEVSFDPTSNPWTTDQALVGELLRVVQTEGGLKGRLTRAGFSSDLGSANANVMVYRDGAEVARTVTDQSGDFRIDNLPAGSYSVMGLGKDGFGVLGLELIDSLAVQNVQIQSDSGDSLVAKQGTLEDTFVMQMAPMPGAITIIEDRVIAEREISSIPLDGTPGSVIDSGYGGMTGSSYAGGGGGGVVGGSGGGMGGGIGAIGAIGAAIAIAIGNDNNNGAIIAPSPVSPSSP